MSVFKLSRVCRIYDPALNACSNEQKIAYLRTRKELELTIIDQPVWFYLRPIPRSAMLTFVMRGIDDTEKYARAFMVSIDRVEGHTTDDGVKHDVFTPRRAEKNGAAIDMISPEDLDAFSIADIVEIGAAAYWRAFLPVGSGAYYPLPATSEAALASSAMDCHYQSAESSLAISEAKHELEEPLTPSGERASD